MSGEGVHNPLDETQILADIADVQEVVDAILEDTDAIREVTDSEAILTEVAGQITTTGALQTIYINNAPAGIFRPICLKIDFTNQEATETVVIRTLYRIALGGGLILQDTVTYVGVVTPELINIDLEPNRYGIQVTIQNTAVGTHRAYNWEIFYEESP